MESIFLSPFLSISLSFSLLFFLSLSFFLLLLLLSPFLSFVLSSRFCKVLKGFCTDQKNKIALTDLRVYVTIIRIQAQADQAREILLMESSYLLTERHAETHKCFKLENYPWQSILSFLSAFKWQKKKTDHYHNLTAVLEIVLQQYNSITDIHGLLMNILTFIKGLFRASWRHGFWWKADPPPPKKKKTTKKNNNTHTKTTKKQKTWLIPHNIQRIIGSRRRGYPIGPIVEDNCEKRP